MGYVRGCFGVPECSGSGARKGGMAESSSGKLRIWEGWLPAVARGPAPPLEQRRPAPRPWTEDPERLAARETMRAPARCREGAEPFTLQWFLDLEQARHGRQGRWIPPLLEFTKHSGETLLGLGQGLGTDWVQYARHGAQVVACCPTAEQLSLVRRNFELRGLGGSFLQGEPTALPLESASIDVACVHGLLHEVSQPGPVVDELYRVLKPGGKVLAVVPARYDVDFWCRRCFPWPHWFRPRRPEGDLAASELWPPVARGTPTSACRLRRLFARFTEPRVHKRHLRRSDVPHLWRWLPLPLLERTIGRLLVFKAFKPLSAAISEALAA
jgi:SAM-dependent methyltransferase